MAKLTLSTISSRYASVAALNANFDAIETALENTLSRDGTTPNSMSANLDMNSNKVINLTTPTNNFDAATKKYVDDSINSGTEAMVSAAAAAASAAAALVSETNAATSETNAAASAAAAAASASSASTSASTASTAATTATTQATNASTSASNAATSESNAAASASAASTSASNAATSASNASTSETNAAASAAAAATTLASALWRDVLFVTSADSPVTLGASDNSKLYVCDTSSGAITFTLPQVSGLTLPYTIGIKKETSDTNSVTINRSGTDTIDGSTSKSIGAPGGTQLLADNTPSPDVWTAIDFGQSAGNLTDEVFTAGAEFTAGVTTALTLSQSYGSEQNIWVFFDGVQQGSDTYSLSGTTLTFDAAIPSGVSKVYVKGGTLLAIGTPGDGTVTTVKIADANVTAVKLATDAVETAKIKDLNVTTGKIAANAVTGAKLNADVVSAQTTVTAVTSDYVLIGDVSDSTNVKKALISDITGAVVTNVGNVKLPKIQSGMYSGGEAESNMAVTANRLYFWPIIVPVTFTITAVTVRVATSAAGNVRVGLYADSNGLPSGAPLYDVGTASTGTTGIKDIATSQSISAGLYWGACVCDATPNLNTVYPMYLGTPLGPRSDLLGKVAGYYMAHTYGALPTVGSLTIGTTDQIPAVWLKG